MKRVVVTGLGIVSPIGNNAAEVTQSLKEGKSGIEFVPEYRDLGFRSQVAGTLKLNVEELVDRRLMRFMGNGAAYAWLSMKQAIEDAGLSEAEISNERTGLVAGSGGPTTGAIVQAALQRGIPYRRLTEGSLVQFGWGSKQRRIQAAEVDTTSAVAETRPSCRERWGPASGLGFAGCVRSIRGSRAWAMHRTAVSRSM